MKVLNELDILLISLVYEVLNDNIGDYTDVPDGTISLHSLKWVIEREEKICLEVIALHATEGDGTDDVIRKIETKVWFDLQGYPVSVTVQGHEVFTITATTLRELRSESEEEE